MTDSSADPLQDKKYRQSLERRFWSKVNVVKDDETCWEWQAHLVRNGYGQIHVMGRGKVMAHRLSYELANGPFPEQLFICHKCDNRKCVRPDHLFLCTHDRNMRDMRKKDRQLKGEEHPNAKLTHAQVREIHRLWNTGQYTQTKIARMFGVSPRNISLVLSGKGWGHIR